MSWIITFNSDKLINGFLFISSFSSSVVNGVTYRVAHTNGVSGNKSVDFNGFTVVLDTIGTKEGTKLTGSITLDKYQTIIAKK